ncbi:MAG: hypothetical protein J6D54_13770 [Olsenella sp.]|nr:hypothetical protein [Olsenella sp.]
MKIRRLVSALLVGAALLAMACVQPDHAMAAEPFSWNGSYWVSADGVTPIEGAWAKGIDVSWYDHEIDWEAVRDDGISFAILRVFHKNEGEGKNSGVDLDPTWDVNASECERLGIPYGAYCFTEAKSVAEAEAEADAVISALEGYSLSYPVYFDMEAPSMADPANAGLFAQMAKAFCNKVEAAGYTPGIYANLTWRSNYLTDPCFDQWTFWLAEWAHPESNPPKYMYTYDGPFDLWQATSRGRVRGINGDVDIDFDFGAGLISHIVEIPRDVEPGSMYRMYNPYSGEHFYTASADEAQAINSVGWWYEGIGWTAPEEDGAPVYRLYNSYAGDHHYTMSVEERDHLVSVGWSYEGVGWLSADEGGVPLYRQYNPYAAVGTHNYTTSKYENDELVRVGWRAEGIAWYGVA